MLINSCCDRNISLLVSIISIIYYNKLNIFNLSSSYLTRNYNYWSSKGVKGPKPLPLVGNFLDVITKSANEMEDERYQKYGRIYGYLLKEKHI
jgi:hypothetical protein